MGDPRPWNWGKEVGSQLWRTTDDIVNRWQTQIKRPNGNCCAYGGVDILDQQVGLEAFAEPGHWNDPDMLEVGNGGMTYNRIPCPLQPVGGLGSPAYSWQRLAEHEA